jgi:hypothetical protein
MKKRRVLDPCTRFGVEPSPDRFHQCDYGPGFHRRLHGGVWLWLGAGAYCLLVGHCSVGSKLGLVVFRWHRCRWAAYLNALHPSVDYPLSPEEVVVAIQAGAGDMLADMNEYLVCALN